MHRTVALVAMLGVTLAASSAQAFCGFYVGGSETRLYNDATVTILMRHGTQTILSMRNDYRGPPEDFAMVVPVPSVLGEENVKTLRHDIFDKVEQLSAPRLVEYWEEEPYCARPGELVGFGSGYGHGARGLGGSAVQVEAQFAVGEYDIVILGAEDSTALETWLRAEGYNIPAGAAALLRPYVEAGTKFFVARVDVSRVRRVGGVARLSPLRIDYEEESMKLPVRLGLMNSSGQQDLLVHILAEERYEAANYPNVFIPTNLVVRNWVRPRFGAFYASLFDRTLERNPGSVVTEYAWSARSCDPCPGPTLDGQDMLTLGADRLPNASQASSFTLTRMHYRYDQASLGEDLMFRRAPPIRGGTGMPNGEGVLQQDVVQSSANSFQARYAILHRHRQSLTCNNPISRGWGGDPGHRSGSRTETAIDTSKVRTRNVDLERVVRHPISALGITPSHPGWSAGLTKSRSAPARAAANAPDSLHAGFAGFLGLFALGWRRRRRKTRRV